MTDLARAKKQMKRKQRGQIMVLGAVTMVVLAFMMMLSFNVGNAINNKIRLQSHSDALAYSIATVEARALNYYAYSNRAIAAVLVAQTTLHGYHSIASTVGSVMWAGAISFFQIAAIEVALCCACPWCACFWHCIDAIQAVIVAFRYISNANQWNNRVRNLETQFNNAVRALGIANDLIHNSQTVMGVGLVAGPLRGARSDFGDLWTKNAPCAADMPMGLAAPNIRNYACALEGAATDPLCLFSEGALPRVPRSKVMANVANASRPRFDSDRLGTGMLYLHPQFIQRVQQIPNGGFNAPTLHRGGGRITNGSQRGQCTTSAHNTEGSTACAWDEGLFTSVGWRHGVGAMVYQAFVASNSQGGAHSALIANPHSGNHPRFRNTQRGNNDLSTDCLTSQGNCFINFRSGPNRNNYYMQPRVFAATSGSMKDLRDNCGTRQPWEMTSDGSTDINDGQRGTGSLTFVPTQDARTISQAMVYYHRYDSWRAAPNMFDPYWRAKLHPFERADLNLALIAAGDMNGSFNSIAPYEGRWP